MRPKNWGEFQHYKNRRPPWIKLHCHLANNFAFYSLPDFDAKHLVLIWIIASEDENGDLPPLKELAYRLRLNEAQTEQLLARLGEWIESDASTVLAEPLQACKQDARLVEERRVETEKETEKTKAPAQPGAPLSFALPVWIEPQTWKAFEEMRRRIRKPMTNRARELIVGKLAKLHATQGQDVEGMLNQSIANGWQDVWPVKDEKGALGGGNRQTRTERNREALNSFIRGELCRDPASGLGQDPGGAGGSAAGHGQPGDPDVIQPSLSQVRTQ